MTLGSRSEFFWEIDTQPPGSAKGDGERGGQQSVQYTVSVTGLPAVDREDHFAMEK